MTRRALRVVVRIMSNDGFSDGIVIRPNRIVVLTAGAGWLLWLSLLWLSLLRRRGWGSVGEERLNGSLNILIFAFLGLLGGDRSGNMKIRQCLSSSLWRPRNSRSGLGFNNRVSI
jgi:hypothetical protein